MECIRATSLIITNMKCCQIMKIILLFALASVVLTGCDFEQIGRDNLGKQTSRLYEIYLNGGRDDARRAAQEANRLVEATKFSPSYQEHQSFALFLGYARLYALERRSGSNDAAQMYLVKARYWALRSEELHGDSPAECNAYLTKFAAESTLMDFIDKWDKNANKGNAPRYIQTP